MFSTQHLHYGNTTELLAMLSEHSPTPPFSLSLSLSLSLSPSFPGCEGGRGLGHVSRTSLAPPQRFAFVRPSFPLQPLCRSGILAPFFIVYSSSLYVNDRVNPFAWTAEEQNVGRFERGRAFMPFLPAPSACPGYSRHHK